MTKEFNYKNCKIYIHAESLVRNSQHVVSWLVGSECCGLDNKRKAFNHVNLPVEVDDKNLIDEIIKREASEKRFIDIQKSGSLDTVQPDERLINLGFK